MARILLVLAVATALGAGGVACFGGGGGSRGDLGGQRRPALARLVVDNRTGHLLSIAFLYAAEPGGPGGEVGVGAVAPGTRAEMAPIPAAEPIILIARARGFERRLEPRSLEIDQLWTWVIRPDEPPPDSPAQGGRP